MEAVEDGFDEVRGEGGCDAVEFRGVGSEGSFGEDGDEGINERRRRRRRSGWMRMRMGMVGRS